MIMSTNDTKLPLSKRVTTIKDIVKYTGYSVATVSNVINKKGFYSTKTSKVISDAIVKYNYHPDAIARGLKKNRTNNIAFLIAFMSEFFSEVFLGVQKYAKKTGHSVSLYSSQSELEQENLNIETIISNKLDGVIVPSTILNELNLIKLVKRNIPVVIIEKFFESEKIPCVSIKSRSVSKKAVNHLIKLGHKKIGFICESHGTNRLEGRFDSRFNGYKDALKENNIKIDDSNIFIDNKLKTELFFNGYECMKKIFSKNNKLTAFFVTSDNIAISAIRALTDMNIKVPDDVSIVGFDGLEITNYIIPRLTTIKQPRYQMGLNAMKMLEKIIKGEKVDDVELQAELVIRESTAKFRKELYEG